MRKSYDSKFKSRVALEAMRGELTIAEIASKYQVHEETSPGRRLGTLHGAFGTEGRAEEDVHGGRFDEENRTS